MRAILGLALVSIAIATMACRRNIAVINAPDVPIQALLQEVPDELHFDKTILAVEENGWITLALNYEKTPRLRQSTISMFEDYGKSLKLGKDPLKRAAFEQVFQKFETHLAVTERALSSHRPLVITAVPGSNTIDIVTGLRVQLSLFMRRAALSLATGNLGQAIHDYETAIAMVSSLGSPGAPLEFAIMSASLWSRVDREIRWAACHPKMTQRGLKELLAFLPEDRTLIKDFQRAIRAELHQFIEDEVQRLRGPGGHSLRERDAKEAFRDFDSGWDKADEVATHVLEGHARPFDRRATVRTAAEIYLEMSRNMDRKWSEQVRLGSLIASLVEKWPFSRLVGGSGESEEAQAELARAKPQLMATENPYGKFAIWYFLQISDHSEVVPFRARVDINATRIVLATRLFKATRGHFPANLEDLKSAQILKQIPVDLFGDRPYQYDSRSERLWSSGPNWPASFSTGKPINGQEYTWSFANIKDTEPETKPPVIAASTVQKEMQIDGPRPRIMGPAIRAAP